MKFKNLKLSAKKILLVILLSTAFFRLLHIDYPKGYVFDEVYHSFTAREFLAGHKEAWEYWTTPPEGVAYEWTHPPLAKEIMALSMFVFRTTDAWAYRVPGVLMGVFSVYLLYLIGKELFKRESTALIAALIFSMDGLNFVQSRSGMNDIYFVTFMLSSLLFFLRKRFIISALLLGLSLASKWTALYALGFYLLLFLIQLFRAKNGKDRALVLNFAFYPLILPIIYMASYIPFFWLGHSLTQFIELQQQMWWYHTGLKATHDYASAWWSWPLNLYPVWYFVDYHENNIISNIFASGNPVVFWLGCGALLTSLWEFWKRKSLALLIVLTGYFSFWLPWAVSPRIMFLYHFSPSVPFLCLALAYQLDQMRDEKNYKLTLALIIGMIILSFLLLYPILTGLPIPKDLMLNFFRTNLTKNPFG